MGTRADFYVGRGAEAEWLGSIAWDGYPVGVFTGSDGLVLGIDTEDWWRGEVAKFIERRSDGTKPEMGWPWPWSDSGTTDFAYAFDEGQVWVCGFGSGWDALTTTDDDAYDDSYGPPAVFPDMTERKNVTRGSRSGIMLIGPTGPIPAEVIDAEEARG